MYYSTTYQLPVCTVTLACDGTGANLVGLWTQGQKYHGGTIPEAMVEKDDIPLFDSVKKWLDRYFAGARPAISELPLAPVGGEFRQGVWGILREIPYGEVTTYGDIAKQMAQKLGRKTMSSQAVGGAVGHNPISIIVPCHRVVGANGSLTGFAGGVPMKIKLLEHEGVDLSNMFVPKKGTAL
ncbi:methylated-DNA--[protein]-cysteine S-methyltransferase [Ruminococcaceae bacterium OttesenSCG-928-D13]|nr:methylated-DNA--[protein]-cysteine S-methyltransferase [Ruminococcaceae bacterium OttesenSCG-928-D13]